MWFKKKKDNQKEENTEFVELSNFQQETINFNMKMEELHKYVLFLMQHRDLRFKEEEYGVAIKQKGKTIARVQGIKIYGNNIFNQSILQSVEITESFEPKGYSFKEKEEYYNKFKDDIQRYAKWIVQDFG